MGLKYLSLILYFSFYLQGAECPAGFVVIEEACYNKKHIDVLQDFIDLNPSLKKIQPPNIGYQEWTNNQLTYLYLGDNNIVSIPDSIGLLKDLNNLDLRKNQIKSIPEGICSLTNLNWSSEYIEWNYSYSYIYNNHLCSSIPTCIEDYLGEQDCEE